MADGDQAPAMERIASESSIASKLPLRGCQIELGEYTPTARSLSAVSSDA